MYTNLLTNKQALATACAGASLLYQQPTKLRVSIHQEEKTNIPRDKRPRGCIQTYSQTTKLWLRLARELLISRRRLIQECRHNRGCLLHILELNAIKHIHIAMVRPCVVLDFILDELEAR